MDETTKKAEEASRLKDQLDEFRHTADKLQKSEAMIDKYKKKLEEVGDLRKQMKVGDVVIVFWALGRLLKVESGVGGAAPTANRAQQSIGGRVPQSQLLQAFDGHI